MQITVTSAVQTYECQDQQDPQKTNHKHILVLADGSQVATWDWAKMGAKTGQPIEVEEYVTKKGEKLVRVPKAAGGWAGKGGGGYQRGMSAEERASIQRQQALIQAVLFAQIDADKRQPLIKDVLAMADQFDRWLKMATVTSTPEVEAPSAPKPVAMPTPRPSAPPIQDTRQSLGLKVIDEMGGDMSGVISGISKTPCATGGTRYGIILKGGKDWLNTFDVALAEQAEKYKRERTEVVLSWIADGKGYKQLKEISLLRDQPPDDRRDDGEPTEDELNKQLDGLPF